MKENELITALKNTLLKQEWSIDSSLALQPKFITNDYEQGKKVLSSIERELASCESFILSVAFITKGGLTPLLQVLEEIHKKGIKGKILTTNYMLMTDPEALKKLASLDNIDLRMYVVKDEEAGFHTKGYIFERDNYLRFLIGSSNITQYALTTNKEWNIELVSEKESRLANEILSEFDNLFAKALPLSQVLEEYTRIYRDHKRLLQTQKELQLEALKLEPNYMQCAFISSLKKLISEGAKRALLVSATGTGKTYASAFAVKELKVKRLLFVVHRAQIANQAIKSFKNVFGNTTTYGLVSGDKKEFDNKFVFATMQTLSKSEILSQFDPSAFDFIIIDEVHRAGAESYHKIMNYFTPFFYLGMSATPDRPDGFDIYRLFDNNIAYEIRLKDALKLSLLCPFHYFAITDLTIDNRVIEEKAEFNTLVNSVRVDHIIEKANYYGYSGNRVKGLIFCSTKEESRGLSTEFNKKGLRTCALTGEDSQEYRQECISRLTKESENNDYLDYIITIDIFNEGVDIPSINQIIMLRPTESPIIFIQQLGRGLRNAEQKEFVVVLDFIGNYSQNYMIPLALSSDRSYNKDTLRKFVMEGSKIMPGSSSVHFDEVTRQRIFQAIDNAKLNTTKLLKDKYFNLKHKLNRIPTAMDFYNYGDIELENFFHGEIKAYNLFLQKYDEEYTICYSKSEQTFLNFVSSYIINGKRIEEVLLLQALIEKGAIDLVDYKQRLSLYNKRFSVDSYKGSLRILTFEFVNSPSEKEAFKTLSFIKRINNNLVITPEFYNALNNNTFKTELLTLLEYATHMYCDKYQASDEHDFVLYEKYTRKDVCRLLNWEKDDSSTMYGYRIKYGTCPIFVTYNKTEDIAKSTAYSDYFEKPNCFNWMTRNKVKRTSPEAIQLTNSEEMDLNVFLFIKKSNDEGTDFYYMGQVTPQGGEETTILNDKGVSLPIMNYKLMLKDEVREDVYDYLVN